MAASMEHKLGPIWLAPGVSRANCWTLYFGAFMSIGLLTFVAIATPYVLNVYLKIPISGQGRITGDLAVYTEIMLIIVFGPLGVIADRIGRRPVYALGLLILAASYVLYPLATSMEQLIVYRVIYAAGVGAATAMLGTIVTDYPQEHSRGKLVAIIGVLNALGVILSTLFLGGLPKLFASRGADAYIAGRDAHWVVAGLCVVTALVLAIGLKKGTPTRRRDRLPVKILVTSGFTEARNPRVALAYACGFIARSDLVVLGTFTVLWGTTAAVSTGIDPAEAVARGRMIFATASMAALLWLPIIGWLLDRINRVSGVALCMGLASVAYLSMLLVGDPLSRASLPLFAFLGIGQISAFACATTLIGQEAPLAKRGVVVGMFNFLGAIGILFSTAVGGRLFDRVSPAMPFALIGSLTLLVVIMALVVRVRSPGPMPQARRAVTRAGGDAG